MFKRKPMPDIPLLPPPLPKKELHDMSYDELASQKISIDQELARRSAPELEALKAKLVAAAAALGVSMQDLFAGKRPEKKKRETRSGGGKSKTQLQARADESREIEKTEAS